MHTLDLSIHQLVGIKVVPTFGVLWVFLLWTNCANICWSSSFSLWSVHLEVGFLGHMLASHFIVWGTTLLSSLEAALFYILTSNAGVPAPPLSHQHLFFWVLVVAILTGVKGTLWFCFAILWWLAILSIFSCGDLAIYVSLEKNYSCLLPIFKWFFCCWIVGVLYIFQIVPLCHSQIWFANAPSYSAVTFSSLGVCTRIRIPMKSNICFSSAACAFGVTGRKPLPNPMPWSFLIFFSEFYGLALTFRDLLWVL